MKTDDLVDFYVGSIKKHPLISPNVITSAKGGNTAILIKQRVLCILKLEVSLYIGSLNYNLRQNEMEQQTAFPPKSRMKPCESQIAPFSHP